MCSPEIRFAEEQSSSEERLDLTGTKCQLKQAPKFTHAGSEAENDTLPRSSTVVPPLLLLLITPTLMMQLQDTDASRSQITADLLWFKLKVLEQSACSEGPASHDKTSHLKVCRFLLKLMYFLPSSKLVCLGGGAYDSGWLQLRDPRSFCAAFHADFKPVISFSLERLVFVKNLLLMLSDISHSHTLSLSLPVCPSLRN